MLSRHLNETQRASVAAKLETLKHGGSRKNQDANLHVDLTRQQAADMLSVSPRSVATAKKVQEAAIPDLELLLKCAEVKAKDKETR